MKKYLFFALALLGMASCAKDDLGNGNKPNHNGEVEESYIAINLMAADSDTRGTSGTSNDDYEEGTDAERVVNTAYFFFFDAQGNPFYVNTTDAPATQPGTTEQKNHLSLSISEVGDPASNLPNVSDIKKAVLILETYKGVYPSQIVAVINWVPTANAYTLEQLRGALVGLRDTGNGTNGFVMSNSVYMDGAGKIVDAVPLTADNIKTSAEAAKTKPVEIYVERIAAKVVLTAGGKVSGTTNIFDTQKDSSPLDNNSATTSEIDVYVQLLGWELYNDHNTSNLLKNIDPTTWGDGTTLGLTWNDRFKFRSYWALSQDKSVLNDEFAWQYTPDKKTEKGFKTEYGFAVANDATYTDDTTYTYCGENTGESAIDGEGKVTPYTKNTKVIIKGQLMQKDGDTYKPLELARWYGTEYAGEEALRIAVANSLKYTLFYSSGSTNFDPIQPDDLICVDGNVVGKQAYEVGFQLSTTGENKTWYKYDSVNGYVKLGNPDTYADNVAKTNEYLKTVQPALLYKTGQTYYIVDIEHFGTKTAAYGVVRNHVYQIDIHSIKGYGSPVYTGTGDIVTPEYPELDESSYVAARINVLSWKIVKQSVDIKQ